MLWGACHGQLAEDLPSQLRVSRAFLLSLLFISAKSPADPFCIRRFNEITAKNGSKPVSENQLLDN